MKTEREIAWTIQYFPVDDSELKEELKAIIRRLEKILLEMRD